MIVKCTPVFRERKPKKVEVTLSRVSCSNKRVIKLNARVSEYPVEEYEEIFEKDIFPEEVLSEDFESFDDYVGDNLDGIIPIDEFSPSEEPSEAEDYFDIEENEEISAEDIFNSFAEEVEDSSSISEIEADLEELENDLRNQLGESEDYDEPSSFYDESIVQRHFVRDNEGTLFESDSDSAEGHEVACYDTAGRLKRACGVIRKGQPVIPADDDDDDIYSRAVSDMFPGSGF